MDDREKKLLRELHTHREELAIQNEALRKARAELEASRDRYADLYELSPVGYMDLDVKGVIRSINATGASLIGFPRRKLEGLPFSAFVTPADVGNFFGYLRRCLKEAGRVDVRISLLLRDGEHKHPLGVHLAGVAVRGEGAAVVRIAIIDLHREHSKDIEEEEEARTRRAALLAGFAPVALSRVDFSEIASSSAALVTRTLGTGFVEVLEFLPDEGRLRTVAAAGKRKLAAESVSARDSPYAQVLRERQPVILDDRPAAFISRAPHLHQGGMRSGIAVLVPADPDRPYGVMGAFTTVRRSYAVDEIHFLTSLANMLGVAASHRRMEAALKASEERFRSLVEHSMMGFFIVQDDQVVFMNPEQGKIFGDLPVPFDLADLERLVHPDDRDKLLSLCREDGTGKDTLKQESVRFHRGGRPADAADIVWTHCRATPIRHHDRNALLVNSADVTRTKELEQIAFVQEKLASLGHMAAGIAHEIRNPLSGINIYAAAVDNLCGGSGRLSAEEKERIRTSLGQLKSASDKIAMVIQRVMDFSRPVAPRLEPVDLNRAVKEAMQLSAVTLRKHGVELSTSLAPDLPQCPADVPLIEQVLLNIIANSDQAMANNDGPKRFEIASFPDNNLVVITISDSGPGVPPHLREKIFDPYFTTRKDGAGIGLSFSRRIVADHGGTLTVGTSRWGGAEFRIAIPVQGKRAKP
jgi:PAS domain S-box-containing protein